MLVIGLTGGVGSGKTTVANLFAKKGINVIDTDQIARDVVTPSSPALESIVDHFGSHLLTYSGTLDRSRLRKIIFSDEKQRLWLENLLHPLIRSEMKNQIALTDSPYCIAVIPLLTETSPNPLINRILLVDTSEDQQIKRTQIRDNLSAQDTENILKSQASRAERLAIANDIITNDGDISELNAQVDKLHQFYLAEVNYKS